MITTEKLYLHDSFALEFEARVLELGRLKNRASVILDRSAFYGEAGGQLGDRGELLQDGRRFEVVDCQYDEAGRLHHLLASESPLPNPAQALRGRVDSQRRRDMMSQHSGQHLLSAVFVQVAGAETVSSRLGGTISTLDLDVAHLDEAKIAQVVEEANSLVLQNRTIRVHYPSAEALAEMQLRRLPKVTEDIRIIEIADYDLTPCGGTHCKSTGEIGPIYLTQQERTRGKLRFSFLCGSRVMARLNQLEAERVTLGELMGCGAAGVAEAVTKLQKDARDLSLRLGEARAALVRLESEELLEQTPVSPGFTPMVLIREREDLHYLRGLAKALVRRDDVVALLAGRDEKGDWRVVLESGSASGFDAGGWFKTRGSALGGRGGGRPNRAEGRFPADLDPQRLVLD